MYPQIKVRDQEDRITVDEEPKSISVRASESLSLEGHHQSSKTPKKQGNNSENRPHSSCAAHVPKSPCKTYPVSFTSTPKVIGIASIMVGEFSKGDKINSILRPRAVLSSPDNDDLIGSRNRLLEGNSVRSKKNINQNLEKNEKKQAVTPTRTKLRPEKSGDKKTGENGEIVSRIVAQISSS